MKTKTTEIYINRIFVFGSYLRGVHGAGPARFLPLEWVRILSTASRAEEAIL